MGHNILAPGQVGPEKAVGWPWAEGKTFLGAFPQPDPPSLTVAWSVGTFLFSPLVTALGTFLLRLEGACKAFWNLPLKGVASCLGRLGWAAGEVEGGADLPPPASLYFRAAQGSLALGLYSTTQRNEGPLRRSPPLPWTFLYSLGTWFLFLSF